MHYKICNSQRKIEVRNEWLNFTTTKNGNSHKNWKSHCKIRNSYKISKYTIKTIKIHNWKDSVHDKTLKLRTVIWKVLL